MNSELRHDRRIEFLEWLIFNVPDKSYNAVLKQVRDYRDKAGQNSFNSIAASFLFGEE